MSSRLFSLQHGVSEGPLSSFDARIFVLALEAGQKSWDSVLPQLLPDPERQQLLALAKRLDTKVEGGAQLSCDATPLQRWTFLLVDAAADMFHLLTQARQVLKPLKELRCQKLELDLRSLSEVQSLKVMEAFLAAAKAQYFRVPRYESSSKDKKDLYQPHLAILCPSEVDLAHAERVATRTEHSSECGNYVRLLAMQAGNDLTPKRYVQTLEKLAEKDGLDFEFYSQKKLESLGAGAFLAVAQGSPHADAGIVKLSYGSSKKKGLPHICLVGKGVTFDTGGTNLKPAEYMYGMHRDMAGSAVAFGLIRLAALEKWPLRITAFLAIADNSNGPKAYRPNDVVTAMNGKTIEIVHTDAEGRMMLADTLHLAAQEKPALVLDFATLTGACIRAISTTYAGAFSNRQDYTQLLIDAGKRSGERVWPFPMDEDFAECLKSDIADIKQCRLTGGVDHIEAALFLKEFVGKDVPWIHIDLAAAEHTGGLGHVDTEVTGFGVRLGAQILQDLFL